MDHRVEVRIKSSFDCFFLFMSLDVSNKTNIGLPNEKLIIMKIMNNSRPRNFNLFSKDYVLAGIHSYPFPSM